MVIIGLVVVLAVLVAGCPKDAPAPAPAPAPKPAPAPAPAPKPAPAPAPKPAPAPAPAPVEPIVWKYANYGGPTLICGITIDWVLDEIEKRTGGKIKFDRYFSMALARPPEDVKFVKANLIQMAMIGPAYSPTDWKLTRVVDSAGMSMTIDAMGYALKKLYTDYEPYKNEWANLGLMRYTDTPAPYMGVTTMLPKYKWEDFEGKKIRTYGTRAILFDKWGATPISIPSTDVYDALPRGIMDGASAIAVISIKAYKWYEVAPYWHYYGEGHAQLPEVISLKAWDALPSDIQQVFMEVEELHYDYLYDTVFPQQVVDNFAAATDSYIIKCPQSEIDRGLEQGLPDIWQSWLDEMNELGLPGQECLDTFWSYVAEYEAMGLDRAPDPFDQLMPGGGAYHQDTFIPWEDFVAMGS